MLSVMMPPGVDPPRPRARIPAGGVILGAFVATAAIVLAFRRSDPAPGAFGIDDRPSGSYALSASGRVTDAVGARLSMRATSADAVEAGAVATIPVASLQGHRVEIVGELRLGIADTVPVSPASSSPVATLRVRLDRGDTVLLVHDDTPITPAGAGRWTRRSFALPVPPGATTLSVHVALDGDATLEARGLRVVVHGRIDPRAPLAPAAQRELDSAIAIVRAHALRHDAVRWATVEPSIRALAAGAATPTEVAPAIKLLLRELDDHHSFHYSADEVTRYQAAATPQPAPEVRPDAGGMGYILVPPHMSASLEAMRAHASALHHGILRVMPAARCGWIVDLREDTGGNVTAMLAGLAPLLGRDTVVRFVAPHDAAGSRESAYSPYSPADAAAELGLTLTPALAALDATPVAVLTGSQTASAGEAIAIAFRGRARTRSFGARTAGVSTGNASFALPSGAALGLTTSVMADRAATPYPAGVAPDEAVPAGDARAAAMRWLRSLPTCR